MLSNPPNLPPESPSPALVFHVSPRGDDRWSGGLPTPHSNGTDGPFATVEHARDAVRARKTKAGSLPSGGVTVILHGGIYPLERGITFGAEDSGQAGAPMVYRAAEGETVRLIGGRRIDPAAFGPVTDPAVRVRLAEAARDRVRVVDLRAQGVTDFGEFVSRGFSRPTRPAHLELFFNDRPMTVAQWPDAGQFATITGFPKSRKTEWGGEAGELDGGFHYDGDRPRRWAPADDIWVHGYWAYDWANSYERVHRLDPETRLVETAEPHGIYYYVKGQRFYFLNVLEELDQPGEYYVDRNRGLLYLYPPEALDGADIVVSTLNAPLLALQKARHIEFRGLTLEGGRGNGVEIEGGEDVRLTGCTLRNLGDWGVRIVGGQAHTVSDCTLYGMGDGGIDVSGGDRATLTPCGHAVLNCRIHHFARWSRCYTAGINASGVGLRIAHNAIHDAPHNAILFWGNEFVIENNEIYRVCLETGDAGAIYTGRDYTFRGNVIRRNFIHHMGGVGMGSIAIYMDDCVSGTHISENILWKCQYGILLGGGRDFRVENNIFVECRPAIHADARGIDPNPVWRKMVRETLRERLDAMCYHESPYRERYPEIAAVDAPYATGQGVPPGNSRVERNLVYRCTPWIGECWPKGADNGIVETNNLIGPDPGFVDADAGNFRLRADSPAHRIGFVPIPVDQIGPIPEQAGK